MLLKENLFVAWAERRGYYTSKAARLDTYRAGITRELSTKNYIFLIVANSLLRLAADGRITLFFRPPGYSKDKGEHTYLYTFNTYFVQ